MLRPLVSCERRWLAGCSQRHTWRFVLDSVECEVAPAAYVGPTVQADQKHTIDGATDDPQWARISNEQSPSDFRNTRRIKSPCAVTETNRARSALAGHLPQVDFVCRNQARVF